VRGSQPLLFPDAKPLVERLGREFFRQLPKRPGVYLMRDRAEAIVYVGKAKNLRQRLGSYRVANPDRVPRRLIRLLNTVVRIEYHECADEAAALAREAALLMELKPRFNRAGVWPAPQKLLAWRRDGERIALTLLKEPEAGWVCHGPLKGGASLMLVSLVRVFWGLTRTERGIVGMPTGWFHGQLPEIVEFSNQGALIESWLIALSREAELAKAELLDLVAREHKGWQLDLLVEDLEFLVRFFAARHRPNQDK
jgi:hypothetical protein